MATLIESIPRLVDDTRAESQRRLGNDDNGRSMTPDEFDASKEFDDEYRYELIRGVLIVSPMAGPGETSPNDALGFLLRAYQRFHPEGRCLDETLPEFYVRTKDSRRRADRVAWIGLGRSPRTKADVPTIVIEFVARSHRDRQRDYFEKRAEYADIGVNEYWVVDRYDRKMVVYRLDGSTETHGVDAIYRTPLMPGFDLPLSELFAAADRFAEDEQPG
jgi:Uma2 family endonuclease